MTAPPPTRPRAQPEDIRTADEALAIPVPEATSKTAWLPIVTASLVGCAVIHMIVLGAMRRRAANRGTRFAAAQTESDIAIREAVRASARLLEAERASLSAPTSEAAKSAADAARKQSVAANERVIRAGEALAGFEPTGQAERRETIATK